jgi:hypothetical protein
VRVAALTAPDAAVLGLALAAVAPPEPRHPVAAAPRPQPAAAAPTPQAPRPAAAPAAPLRAAPQTARLQSPPQPARAPTARLAVPAAAPARVVRAPAAQPVRVVRVQPSRAEPAPALRAQPQPARAAAAARVQAPRRPAAALAAPRREPGLGRGSLALVGVFGNANGRHALVQLPDGSTERVRPGDTFRGVQITAIAADAVHLRAQGRDAVLKLPE